MVVLEEVTKLFVGQDAVALAFGLVDRRDDFAYVAEVTAGFAINGLKVSRFELGLDVFGGHDFDVELAFVVAWRTGLTNVSNHLAAREIDVRVKHSAT